VPKKKPPKPKLAVVKGVSVEDVVALYRALTGREPTAEEVEQAKRDLEERAGRQVRPAGPSGTEPG
jgi:hypothetical protein